MSMRPLDRLPSIRAKLAVVIVFAVGMTVVLVYLLLGFALARADGFPGRVVWTFGFVRDHWWQLLLGGAVAAAVALLLARLLALGMTRPLRDMAHAAAKMAQGDYSQRVRTASRDEVGELATAFNGMSAELEQVEKLRRELVANVSHELKTPIGALGLLAETMAGEEDGEMLRRLADRVLHEAERLERTVEDLLDLSLLEAQENPERDLIPVDLIMQDAAERMAAGAEAAGIPIEVTEPASDILVSCDRRQVTSALFNLLDNAVKYSEEGGKVEFAAEMQGSHVAFSVRDHGIGIPGRDLERIFERFYRVDRTRSRATGGTGLGLAIVRHVAQAHGGEVSVESEEGQGSTFRLKLPLAAATRSRRTGRS
jgi:signal transduction histidine kinase